MVTDDSNGIARELLAIRSEALGPLYDDLRDKLHGELSQSALRLGELQQEREGRIRNNLLVQRLLSVLPQPSSVVLWGNHKAERFVCDTPYDVARIRSSVLDVHGSHHISGLCYVIGVDKGGSERDPKSLLLGKISRKKDKAVPVLRSMQIGRRSHQALAARRDSLLTTPLTQEQTDELYSWDSGQFYTGAATHAWVESTLEDPRKPFGWLNPDLRLADTYDDAGKLLSKLGPSDDEMRRYNVIEQFNELAVLFDCEEQMDAIFASPQRDDSVAEVARSRGKHLLAKLLQRSGIVPKNKRT